MATVRPPAANRFLTVGDLFPNVGANDGGVCLRGAQLKDSNDKGRANEYNKS